MRSMNETDHAEDHTDTADQQDIPKRKWRGKELVRVVVISLACLIILAGAVTGYVYASSPVTVRQPLLEHYHFRMQILVNGKAENFANAKYQTGYSKDNCNVALPAMPIHFHDSKDQFVHIHWEGTTGGQVLKYYGWNFVGGMHDLLGYRFDQLPNITKVPIHGEILPTIPNDATFYIYTGDSKGYKEKKFDDFTHQDLEKFFGVTSNFPAHKLNEQKRHTSFLNVIEPSAHAAPDNMGGMSMDSAMSNDTGAPINDNSLLHTDTSTTHSTGAIHSQEELKRINNLLGNVVIFVQKDKPSDQQIKDRFNHLEPLSDSVCGG